jgi:hypothetical protein
MAICKSSVANSAIYRSKPSLTNGLLLLASLAVAMPQRILPHTSKTFPTAKLLALPVEMHGATLVAPLPRQLIGRTVAVARLRVGQIKPQPNNLKRVHGISQLSPACGKRFISAKLR